jgi:phosphoglycerate dehydrogenase-like enzyme
MHDPDGRVICNDMPTGRRLALTGMNKLVLWDEAWLPWAHEYERQLPEHWRMAAGSGLDFLREEIVEARALVSTAAPPVVREYARSLEVLLYPGAGCTHIRPEHLPRGCRMCNVFEHEAPIAEYVLMMMLVHSKQLLPQLKSFAEGKWEGSGRLGGKTHGELSGRTVGLFGFGHIGRAVATRAEGFGMRVLAVSRTRGSLREMLPQCDFLVIAAPLTEETRGRIGAAELALLPQEAFLINVARAEIVDEQALFDALHSGSIAGAALDVWYEYPATGGRGWGSKLAFHMLPNVIRTAHYSAWTEPMILRRIERSMENLLRLDRGEELERVVTEGTWAG